MWQKEILEPPLAVHCPIYRSLIENTGAVVKTGSNIRGTWCFGPAVVNRGTTEAFPRLCLIGFQSTCSREFSMQITFKNLDHSPVVQSAIQEEAEYLYAFIGQTAESFKVLIEIPHHHHRRGVQYRIRIEIAVRGQRIVVVQALNRNVYKAIKNSFAGARKQVIESLHRRRSLARHGEFPETADAA